MKNGSSYEETIGLDLSDETGLFVVIDAAGEVVCEGKVALTLARRWGLKMAGTGNKMRKNKAVIAVARKLSVLLHRLWLTGEVNEPLRQERLLATAAWKQLQGTRRSFREGAEPASRRRVRATALYPSGRNFEPAGEIAAPT